MGRVGGIKWEKTTQCRPSHNIISSDFPKYNPQPWKFMEGKSRVGWLLSYEYQRMWMEELEAWKKRIYPENTAVNVDVVKRYVLSFKTDHQPPKPEKKKPFKMKKNAYGRRYCVMSGIDFTTSVWKNSRVPARLRVIYTRNLAGTRELVSAEDLKAYKAKPKRNELQTIKQ